MIKKYLTSHLTFNLLPVTNCQTFLDPIAPLQTDVHVLYGWPPLVIRYIVCIEQWLMDRSVMDNAGLRHRRTELYFRKPHLVD